MTEPQRQAATGDRHTAGPIFADAGAWRTFAGTIRSRMLVRDDAGRLLGRVARVEGDQVRLEPVAGGAADTESLPLSLVAGVSADTVLLAPRGDASFGLGAQP